MNVGVVAVAVLSVPVLGFLPCFHHATVFWVAGHRRATLAIRSSPIAETIHGRYAGCLRSAIPCSAWQFGKYGEPIIDPKMQ